MRLAEGGGHNSAPNLRKICGYWERFSPQTATFAKNTAMPTFIHEQENWTDFRWDSEALLPLLGSARHLQGMLMGRMAALGFEFRQEAFLETLTEDVLKTSEIEGEFLHLDQVRSSLAHLWFVTMHPFDDGNGHPSQPAALQVTKIIAAFPTSPLPPRLWRQTP